VIKSDGQATDHYLEIEVAIKGNIRSHVVSAKEFPRMEWLTELGRIGGIRLILFPGSTKKDEMHAAIQFRSERSLPARAQSIRTRAGRCTRARRFTSTAVARSARATSKSNCRSH
jgi:hypothetical protein